MVLKSRVVRELAYEEDLFAWHGSVSMLFTGQQTGVGAVLTDVND
jgi:hypothetical protein